MQSKLISIINLFSQVVSVTFLNSGDDPNVAPKRVEFGGTLRAFSSISFNQLVKRIEEVKHQPDRSKCIKFDWIIIKPCIFLATGDCSPSKGLQMLSNSGLLQGLRHDLSSHGERRPNVQPREKVNCRLGGARRFSGRRAHHGSRGLLVLRASRPCSLLLHRHKKRDPGVSALPPFPAFHD